ncbi:MAG TPA: DUF1800 domain-containing protein [Gemmataceae bacterium]|nr:DUF1800 domain-containing protein [Gemmataceae bacterium]
MKDRQPSNVPPCWSRYTPSAEMPWDVRRVVHLHRRATFAATWREVRRDLEEGPQASIDRLLAAKGGMHGEPDRFAQTADALADSAMGSGDPGRLKAWWVYRMLNSPDPLTERLTLLWHNHFATSNLKINDLAIMRRQNEIFRRHARGRFGTLLRAVVRDPAMLIWLDASVNRKGHPNENLARELMELFTLGISQYTEKDVKEAARSLTGWTMEQGAFREDPSQHDDGAKTILAQTGQWNAEDLVQLLLDHPATAQRLAWRICDLLMGEGTVRSAAVAALAEGLRARNLDIGWAVETVLRSQAFFAPANLGSRVLEPVAYVVGAARALELAKPAPSSMVLADWCGRLGQDLFYPPNVGGWPGGRSWISPHTMIGRANFAAALLETGLVRQARPVDVLALPKCYGRGEDVGAVLAFYSELLLGSVLDPTVQEQLLGSADSRKSATPQTLRRIVARLLASAEAQLG